MKNLKLRIPIYKDGVFLRFEFTDLSGIPKNNLLAGFRCYGCKAKEPELFTGELDSEGHEIYENDILGLGDKGEPIEYKHKVVFENCMFMLESYDAGLDFTPNLVTAMADHWCIINSNIHDLTFNATAKEELK